MSNINDFGKKIGGARKDLWKLRGLLRHDILDMNEGEKTKYVCKNNIWLKPINDFGKKIGGARKDLWKLRGLLRHDILDMNEGEKTKYVCKNNIWLKPDIPTLLDNGIPRFVIYWRNEIRKAIYPSPRNNISFEDYIEGVHSIEELANAVISEKKVYTALRNWQTQSFPKTKFRIA